MIHTQALILEPCDFTPDGNLRKEAFDSLTRYAVVLSGGVLLKASAPTEESTVPEPVKRVRKAKVQTVIDDGPAADEPAKPLTSGMAFVR